MTEPNPTQRHGCAHFGFTKTPFHKAMRGTRPATP